MVVVMSLHFSWISAMTECRADNTRHPVQSIHTEKYPQATETHLFTPAPHSIHEVVSSSPLNKQKHAQIQKALEWVVKV